MRRAWLCVCVLAGCTSEPVVPDEIPPEDFILGTGESVEMGSPHIVGECAHQVSLYGMGPAGSTPVGPVTVDAIGIDVCLTLDTTDNLQVAHFAAGTEYEAGGSSSFELGLYDRDGNLIRNGWDVTFGSNPSTTFANLEVGFAKGQVFEAVLWVRAKSGSASSMLSVYLFEPYE